MSLKLVLPWLCAAAALAGAAGLYFQNSKLAADLAQTKAENQDLQQYKAAAETNTPAAGITEELARLRKDNEDLLRLRNEARQLRQEKQQLTTQLAAAQGQVQSAQAQAMPGRVWDAQSGSAVTPATHVTVKPNSANTATLTAEQMAMNTCINNLRQIDAAKQQWALENKKPDNTLVSDVNITPYLPGNALPVCPSGGSYTINPVGVAPTCSVPGHQLGK